MASIKHLLWQDSPKPKRNFIKENVKKIKDIEKSGQDAEFGGESKRHQNISALSTNRMSKSNSNQQYSANNKARALAAPNPLHRKPTRAFPVKKLAAEPTMTQFPLFHERDKPLTVNLPKTKEPPKGFRNQACQTVSGKELDYFSHKDVIRYPSRRHRDWEEEKSPTREMGLQTDDLIFHSPTKAGGDVAEESRTGSKNNVDFVKLNMMAPLKPKETNTKKEDPIRAPSTYQKGVLPKYLREQRKNKENESERSGGLLEGDLSAQLLLPDDLRKTLLAKLKKEHKEKVDQLNLLPFSTSSLKTLQRKQQIEKELDILEKRISNFSREKVFIQDVTVT